MKMGRLGRAVSTRFARARDALVRATYTDIGRPAPVSPPAPIRSGRGLLSVHVGCGEVVLPGWWNADVRWFPHVHYVGDVTVLQTLPDASADRLYASHVLEHIPYARTEATLGEWARVLARGGELFVAVPDFDRIVQRYEKRGRDVNEIVGPLMGEQNYPANTHLAVFNHDALKALLERAGFTDVRNFDPDEVLGSSLTDNSRHEVSLNLYGKKA